MRATTARSTLALLAGLIVLGACGASDDSGEIPTTDSIAVSTTDTTPLFTRSSTTSTPITPITTPLTSTEAETTSTTQTAVGATASTTTTNTATPNSATNSAPLDLVDGKILGIGVNSRLRDAELALGVAAVLNPVPREGVACTEGDAWVIRSNNLNMFFEGASADQALLSNWSYTGGPALGYSELIAPDGLRIGDSRAALVALYGENFIDNEIRAAAIEFVVDDNGVIERFGVVECATEIIPDDE